jgi:putative nucleotidyltransferase with HDIG domain
MMETLTLMLTARDGATAEHARRVQQYATALAAEICGEDERLIEAVRTASLLHDIGKLAIPDRLLQKAGPLTRDEFEQVKQHAALGAAMLEGIAAGAALSQIVRHHHENWDGSGYPDGLRGDDIPLGARVLSITDCYDALTSERPYRRRLTHACAVAAIVERRGTMYDPALVDAFVRIVHRLRGPVQEPHAPVPHAFQRRAPRLI